MNNSVENVKISKKTANDTFEGTEITRQNEADGTAAAKRWFREAQFGMMIHWGLYSIPGRGEWVRSDEEMPEAAYMPYFQEFTAFSLIFCGLRYKVNPDVF